MQLAASGIKPPRFRLDLACEQLRYSKTEGFMTLAQHNG
jgi:hypothetical protein